MRASSRMEPSHAPTFAEMFATRLGALAPEARRFLETLAICGRPMAPDLVCDACGVARERQSLVAMLRASRFIRSSGSSERVETYHDRIREVLAAQIAPDAVRRIHAPHGAGAGREAKRRLRGAVRALPRRRRPRERGDSGRPCRRRRPAPRSPSIAPRPSTGTRWRWRRPRPPPHAWREGLATALANAGRPAEAAEAYLRAAAGAGDLQRVELQRRGAEQFLIGGHIDRGLELIRTMLASMGMRRAAKPARRAAVAVVAPRTAAMARVALRFEGRRRHRRRCAPARRHLLVGDDGIVAGGHDQRRRISARVTCSWRSMPASRTVSRARWRSSRRPGPPIRAAGR